MKLILRVLLVLSIFVLSLATNSAFAQFGASLQGTVEDASGAVLSGATVTITNLATQVSRGATTSANGFYQFSELPPGNYSVKVDAPNFKSSTVSPVTVVAEVPRGIDVKLQPGGAQESVTVSAAELPNLQTTDANIGNTIDNQSIERLPVYGRDPYELLHTTIGISGDSARQSNGTSVFLPNNTGAGQSNAGIFQTENQIQISADGHRPTENNYLVDGVSVNSLGFGGAAVVTPNPESISEMSVVATSFSAEDGRNSGAQVKVVTKSGTDQFHGTGHFQYDEPGLNAFTSYGGPDKQLPQRVENKQREYAASLGGPLVKNKLFFFLSYEGFTNGNSTTSEEWVETPQFRQAVIAQRPGSVSAQILNAPGILPRILKVLPSDCSLYIAQPNKYPNPSAVCNPVAGGIDIGSFTGGAGQYVDGNNFVGGGLDGIPDVQLVQLFVPNNSKGNQYNGRVDWYVTPHDQFAASVFATKLSKFTSDPGQDARSIADTPLKPLTTAATAIYIHTFSPTFINELRGNATRFADNQLQDSAGVVNWGIPNLDIQNLPFPQDIKFGANQSNASPALFAQNTYEVRDMATKTLGSRTLKFGVEIRWEQDNNNLLGAARPTYSFQGLWNLANSTPIYEGIDANPNNGGPAQTQRYLRTQTYGAFVQHDWRITPTFTLNTGLRYEYFSPLTNKGLHIFYPQLGPTPATAVIDAIVRPVDQFWKPDYGDFSPKIGFAYSPSRFNSKVVFRGGFAVAYDRLNDNLFENAVEDGPNFANYGICCSSVSSPTNNGSILYAVGSSASPFSYPFNPALATGVNPANNLPNPFGTNPLAVEVWGAHPNTPVPYSYLFSLETQFELPGQFVATIGYQGSVGHEYPRIVNQNFLYPTCSAPAPDGSCPLTAKQTPLSAAYFATNDVHSNYNALNLQLLRRFQHGFQFNVNYSYAKSLDQASNGDYANSAGNQTDPAQPWTEYGPSDYDLRHRVTATGVWDLPKYHNGNGFLGQVLSGWQINGVMTYHTGYPWTPVTHKLNSIAAVSSAATINPTRPTAYFGGAHNSCSNDALINGSNFPNGGTSYFNIATPGPPGIGRNSFRGACYFDTDMSFAKEQHFKFFGRENIFRFQANMYNIFNKLNLQPITFGTNEAVIEAPEFGKAPGADAGRVIEFSARIQF